SFVDYFNFQLSSMDASDSPRDQIDAPSNTISFNKNCPGTTAKAGNPPKLGTQPVSKIRSSASLETSVSPACSRQPTLAAIASASQSSPRWQFPLLRVNLK